MIIEIGFILSLFIIMPILAAVVIYCLVHDTDLEYEEYQTCGSCNWCYKDFGIWTCGNEESYFYEKPVDTEEDGCLNWKDDGTWAGLL